VEEKENVTLELFMRTTNKESNKITPSDSSAPIGSAQEKKRKRY
jgi:hypothetical protein